MSMLNKLVFDNWRILHGRSSFTGNRRMCGGYSKPPFFFYGVGPNQICLVNRDDYMSRLILTSQGRGEVLREL